MSGIITRENILKEKMQGIKEGDFLLKLFQVADEVGIGGEIELQNKFTLAALEILEEALKARSVIDLESSYKGIKNIYYVVELYLRGYSSLESYMGFEEFLLLVKEGKSNDVIEDAGKVFESHINRLKKIISKSKKKIPWGNKNFKETKNLLEQIEYDLRFCLNYPTTPANLSDFYFGSYHEYSKPILISKTVGIIALEETIYGLYKELGILSKMKIENINMICEKYAEISGNKVYFNLFEKVINNYLLAIPYSNTPEDLQISSLDASLLINEVRMNSLNSKELVSSFIDRYEFKEREKEYLENYALYLQKRIDSLKDSKYFGELFVVTK